MLVMNLVAYRILSKVTKLIAFPWLKVATDRARRVDKDHICKSQIREGEMTRRYQAILTE